LKGGKKKVEKSLEEEGKRLKEVYETSRAGILKKGSLEGNLDCSKKLRREGNQAGRREDGMIDLQYSSGRGLGWKWRSEGN